MAIANVIGTATCIVISSKVAKLTTIPYGFLAPFMIMVISFAAFQVTRSLEDLILLNIIGIVGILFKFFNWSRPALLVGFVLADTVETYLYQAVQFYDWGFIARPGVIVILIFIIGSVVMGNFLNRAKKSKVKSLPSESENKPPVPYTFWSGELVMVLGVIVFLSYFLIDSVKHSFLGKVFPMSISVVILGFALLLVKQLTSPKQQKLSLHQPVLSAGKFSEHWVLTWKNFLWIIGLTIGTWLLGFLVALFILFIAIIRNKTNSSWVKTLFITSLAVGFLIFISNIMVLHLPTGLIYDTFFLKNE